MPLGLGSGLWACILPVAATNLVENPSLEYGSAGWSVLGGGATIGTTSYKQAFGAWSLQINHTITSEGAFYNAGTPAVGSYTVSGFVNGTSGHRYRLLAETGGGAVLGVGSITSVGGWQSIVVPFGLATGTGVNITARHIDAANGTFYLDGLQLESGTNQTTYIDGDQDGCLWTGAPHVTTSTRSGQYRGGGSLIALADLGLSVDQMPGAGMPPIETSSQSYAITDGAQYQRTRAAARHFTLTVKPIVGTSLADFHVTRRTLIDAFKPDLVTPQQPTRFLYVGGQGTVQIDGYYEKGLELGNMDGVIAENAAISFIAPDPYWYAPTQSGTTLAPRVNLGSANWIVNRDPHGKWGTMGPAGVSLANGVLNSSVVSIAIGTDQLVYVGGAQLTAGGTQSPKLSVWNPVAGNWGTLSGGTIGGSGAVRGVIPTPSGSILIGGNFTQLGGTAVNNIGFWARGTFGTFGGDLNNQLWSMAYTPGGTLFMSGDFTLVNGTTAPRLAQLANGAFGSLVGQAGGTINNSVYALTIGLDRSLAFGGLFTAAGGTTMNGIGRWANGAFGSMGLGVQNGGVNTFVFGLTTMPNGNIAVTGNFGSAGGVQANNIAIHNGVQFQAIGSGLGSADNLNYAYKSSNGPNGGLLVAGAFVRSGSVTFPDGMVLYNGASFVPLDIDLGPSFAGGTAILGPLTLAPSGTLYAGGDFRGTAYAASVTTLINGGRAIAYPVLRMRNTSASGTARLYQIANNTTNAAIYFNNLTLLPGEQAVLTTQPGNRSFQSSFFGNIFGAIMPGSNLASFNLQSGTNYVSFFSDNDSLEASLYWQPRSWSIDGGTI